MSVKADHRVSPDMASIVKQPLVAGWHTRSKAPFLHHSFKLPGIFGPERPGRKALDIFFQDLFQFLWANGFRQVAIRSKMKYSLIPGSTTHSSPVRLLPLTTRCYNASVRVTVEPDAHSRHAAIGSRARENDSHTHDFHRPASLGGPRLSSTPFGPREQSLGRTRVRSAGASPEIRRARWPHTVE